jgi:hypothetical protein
MPQEEEVEEHFPTLLLSWIAENKRRYRDQRIREKERCITRVRRRNTQSRISTWSIMMRLFFIKQDKSKEEEKEMIITSIRKIILLLPKNLLTYLILDT